MCKFLRDLSAQWKVNARICARATYHDMSSAVPHTKKEIEKKGKRERERTKEMIFENYRCGGNDYRFHGCSFFFVFIKSVIIFLFLLTEMVLALTETEPS